MKTFYSSLLFFSLPLFFNPLLAIEQGKYKSIEELVIKGVLSAEITGMGGHSKECVEFDLKNYSADSTFVWIEAGRRLESADPAEQDIFIVKNEQIALAPLEKRTVKGYGFCCQAHNSSPQKKSRFLIGMMAPAMWVVLANWIDRHNFPPSAVQNAIWVLSDQHDIRSIPALQDRSTFELRKKVAELLDIELPWYSFTYTPDSTQLFSGKRSHLFAEVAFEIPYRALINGEIRDKSGKLLHQTPHYYAPKGENIFVLNTSIEGWQQGEYSFSIIEDLGTLNQKKHFTID